MIPAPGLNGLLDGAVAAVRQHRSTPPLIGVVLGSGLGAFGDTLDGVVKVPYADIPKMPMSRVVGHAGNLCLGSVEGVEVACMQGRVHLYEGHEPERVVFGVRLLAKLGCKAVLLTNAAGGVHASMRPGDLMLIVDHINLTGRSPLMGPNIDSMGERFPDMSQAYDPGLCDAARKAALEVGVALKEGVYQANLGPSYETPAEIRMARAIGADAVGMSTVPEVIALRHMKVRTAAISCITNLAAGISLTPLNHKEVEQIARLTRDAFVRLLSRWVRLSAVEVAK
ncbi:MAG: purine-nucleoside phosphorylase [Deltaproteobacteria bacterium]|nr:purine-nucleoside phosphorylase [Deltaproteobacteria bacterium]